VEDPRSLGHWLPPTYIFESPDSGGATKPSNASGVESGTFGTSLLDQIKAFEDDWQARAEPLERLLQNLNPRDREILQLRLQGCTAVEIAGQIDSTQFTVEAVLKKIRQRCLAPLT
jgi:DNA-binding NarL/FixJ family response regulator